MTVAANLSQLVYVDVPTGYNLSALPQVASTDGNLIVFTVGYHYPNGSPQGAQLVVDVGNPFPGAAVSGSLIVSW